MKIQVVSDIHAEFGLIQKNYDKMVDTPADVLVLAGDIASSNSIISVLKKIKKDCSHKQIIFVAGNHEFYGTSRKTLDPELMSVSGGNLNILIERDIVIGGIIFVGTTGWWDGSGGTLGMTVKYGLNDFRMIYDLMDNGDGVWWGQKSKTFIDSKLYFYRDTFPDMKRVIVTHHFPHRGSISSKFQGSALNVCFYNAWEDLIQEYRPELWIHGHTHDSFDYKVGGNWSKPDEPSDDKGYTRIVCNPQGYPEKFISPKDALREHYENDELLSKGSEYNTYLCAENDQFDPCKVVEI